MSQTEARFEFRRVAPNLMTLAARLHELTAQTEQHDSLELYLVPRGRYDLNLKIRDDSLELKTLIEVIDGLQRWRPEFKLALPMDAATLRQRLAGWRCESMAPAGRAGDVDAKALLEWIARHDRDVGLVSVHKQRARFVVDACAAEFVRLLVNGAGLHAVAFESGDAAAVSRLRERLGLQGQENVSYPLAIERVRGNAPLPADAFYNALPK